MKNFKKLMTILTSVLLVLGLGTARVSAHEVSVGSTEEKHTFEIYQVFTGDSEAGSQELTNIKYGKNTSKTANEAVAQEDVDAIQNLKGADDAEDIANVAPFIDLDSAPFETVKSGEAIDLPTGYYLFKDVTSSLENESTSLYVLTLVNDAEEISPKVGTVTSEKKLQDINDSTDTEAGALQDSADYDIGDNVPYTLTAKLANNVTDYTKYHITFVDTLEAGKLANNEDYEVYVGETKLDASEYEVTGNANGFELTLTWTGAENAEKPGTYSQITDTTLNGATVTVKFTAELLEGANIGNLGNRNTMKLKFSNNPNCNDDGTPKEDEGETPEDTVIVFTYKLVVNKVDEGKKPLEGASFALYKKLAAPTVDDEACEEAGYGAYYLVSEIDGSELTEFVWNGIDDGDYVLVETVTPEGYNSIDPIKFTVTATHKDTFNITSVGTDSNGADVLETLDGGDLGTGVLATGAIATDVVNQFGAELPETGGMGTTIFYTVGGLLVLGAIIMLIQKRRMAE